MDKKYELTNETIDMDGHILHRIRALVDFYDVKSGDLGGYIESHENLSHNGCCWVYDNSMVFEHACVAGFSKVRGDSKIHDHARIAGHADISENAVACGYAHVHDRAKMGGNSRASGFVQMFGFANIYGNAWICGNSVYVYGAVKLYSGCWDRIITMNHKEYLVSTTLEKLELG